MNFANRFIWALGLSLLCANAGGAPANARSEFAGDFAPAEGFVKPQEKPFRDEVCLNGAWQFQPVAVPVDFKRGAGEPPELPMPKSDRWDATPIKVPSPWNVNTWGCGRNVGAGTEHPLWPDSVYFPSYPESWDRAEMGWLRKTFRVPADWTERRVMLHFEAVAGECQVFVNGQRAGSHFDKYLPFDLDVTRLVRRDGDNELLVGVRSHSLFEKRSERYPKMRAPYPCGSETEPLVGIWQDVFLLGLPPVRIKDVFVKPLVASDEIELEFIIRNESDTRQKFSIGGEIHPWINLAGDSPEPKWKLDPSVYTLAGEDITLGAGASAKVQRREKVAGRLKFWTSDSPNLYALVLDVKRDGHGVDSQFTRFGWRHFSISGKNLLLNGQPIKLTGDFLHPFGPFVLSRSYVWAWYKMIHGLGGNSVRPHAQPMPRHFLDLADEMGIAVLDETAIFGSSIALNFEEPIAWQRFSDHYDGLVLRDRNHPSVFGWSFGNELFAIFNLNNVTKEDADKWYRQLAELGAQSRKLDPTRDWISCDGDEDLRGALPVWSKHFGHGTPLDRLPDINKPMMVGESGGTYYARPKQLAEFNGARAYESYEGRNEALAIDAYDNIVRMAQPKLAYFSASETAWFGIEHLNFGYHDFARLPGKDDGVFFTKPFAEGKPGIQIERLPPYVAALNPGWDSSLPIYKPLAMFDAEKAALAKGGPKPCAWDHKSKPVAPIAVEPVPTIEKIAFVGDRSGALARRLIALGVPLAEGAQDFTIVDAGAMSSAALAQAKQILDSVRNAGGTVLAMLGPGDPPASLFSAPVRLTDRTATALVPDATLPWTASFTLPDLYFAEDGADRFIQKHGIESPLIDGARLLLSASQADWAEFNNAPEKAKCAAVVLDEHLVKPSGAALVECDWGKGKLVVCSLDYRVASHNADSFWRKLLTNAGIKLGQPVNVPTPAFDDRNALINALAIGRFAAANLDEAVTKDFIGEAAVRPASGARTGDLLWQPVNCPSRDRFVLHEMKQTGAESGAFAVYFSFSIRGPRALDDLLADGPDAPRFTMFCYAADKCRLFLNGREIAPARTEPADYRTRYAFENLPLKKDWNRILIKVASENLRGAKPATLAVRIGSTSEDFLRQIESAVELPPSQAK